MVEMPYSTQQCLRFPESMKNICVQQNMLNSGLQLRINFLFLFLLCKGKTTILAYSLPYAWFDLLSKWCYTSILDLLSVKKKPFIVCIFPFVFFVTGLNVLLRICFRGRWSTILITARSTTTYWNKHFSSDTCINSLLVHLNMQNTYLSFCLAFFCFWTRTLSNESRS